MTRRKPRGEKPAIRRDSKLMPKNVVPKTAEMDSLPLYCDYSCPKADFPPADTVGACRREQAVWCSVLRRYNSKNGKCLVRMK